MKHELRKELHALDREDTDGIFRLLAKMVGRSNRYETAMAGDQRTPRVRYGHILEALQDYDAALFDDPAPLHEDALLEVVKQESTVTVVR
jgi:hypothetical protein